LRDGPRNRRAAGGGSWPWRQRFETFWLGRQRLLSQLHLAALQGGMRHDAHSGYPAAEKAVPDRREGVRKAARRCKPPVCASPFSGHAAGRSQAGALNRVFQRPDAPAAFSERADGKLPGTITWCIDAGSEALCPVRNKRRAPLRKSPMRCRTGWRNCPAFRSFALSMKASFTGSPGAGRHARRMDLVVAENEAFPLAPSCS